MARFSLLGLGPTRKSEGDLVRLAYELLDAHFDTALLAADLDVDPQWDAHLGYLRDLQRVGRETLAKASGGENE